MNQPPNQPRARQNALRVLPAPPDPDAFWAKVDRSGGPHACWPWTAARFHYGHGAYKIDGRPWGAHRIAFHLANGPIEDGHYVLHICDNPPCCNPTHLYAGTLRDNRRDAERRRVRRAA